MTRPASTAAHDQSRTEFDRLDELYNLAPSQMYRENMEEHPSNKMHETDDIAPCTFDNVKFTPHNLALLDASPSLFAPVILCQ